MILACDVGSTYTKVAVLARPKNTVRSPKTHSEAQAPSSLICASYRKFLPLEQQKNSAWTQLLSDIASVLKEKQNYPIEAISFSTHGPSLLAIDRDGHSIPHPSNPIHRTDRQLQSFRSGSSFYLPLARALWTTLEPHKQQQVARLLPPASYLCFLLTGQAKVPIPKHYAKFFWPTQLTAPDTALFSPDFQDLDRQFLTLLAPLVNFYEPIGHLNKTALQQFQFPLNLLGIPVFCPGVDFFAAEAGLCDSSDSLLRNRTGTSEGFNLFLPEAPLHTLNDKNRQKSKLQRLKFPPGFFLNDHVIKKRPLLSFVQEASGLLFAQLFARWQKLQINTQINNINSKPNKLLQNLNIVCIAPSNPQYASLQQTQENLMLQHIFLSASSQQMQNAKHFATRFIQSHRPILEIFDAIELQNSQTNFPQIGCIVLQLLVQLFILHCDTIFNLYEQYSGNKILHDKQVLLSGGQAFHPSWLEWKAKQSQMIIHVPCIFDAEFIGAAAICYYQLGYFPNIEQASRALVKIAHIYT